MIVSDADLLKLPLKEKRYKHSVGESIYLEVWPTGQKYWRWKYRFQGREKTYAIGVFPKVSLADAFKARDHARGLIREGLDPVKARRHIKQNPPPKSIFRLALSQEGELTIETDKGVMALTFSQMVALQDFLNSGSEMSEESPYDA